MPKCAREQKPDRITRSGLHKNYSNQDNQGNQRSFLRILKVAFFSRLLAMRISYRFFPSETTINAVLGGIVPKLSANMVISFTSLVGSRVRSKCTDFVLSFLLKEIN